MKNGHGVFLDLDWLLSATSRLRPDRGGAMAAQAPAALNFRHDFNGWRVKEALIRGYRGVACGSVISSLRREPGLPTKVFLIARPACKISTHKFMVKTLLKALAL
ncbi:hypothetical protein [Rhizobium phaseoli]|uniref:hypothetical protein n=1 Tax=Rhizobium phaseoli TaxID=396 RepID=UPI0014851E2F|nr:hypothetical protein [Rhizobium phaseoli]